MSDDILLTCKAIEFEDGYPVLRQVFRHLARTPEEYVIWIDPSVVGEVHLLVQYSNRHTDHYGDLILRGGGRDYLIVDAPHGFEGGVEIVMIDTQTGNGRATHSVHFGGLT